MRNMDINFYNRSYSAARVYGNDRFTVSLGGGCRMEDVEKVAIVSIKTLGITIIGGQDLFDLIKNGGTSNADKIALSFASQQWAKQPDMFIAQFEILIESCYKTGCEDGRRKLQSEFCKLIGIAWA